MDAGRYHCCASTLEWFTPPYINLMSWPSLHHFDGLYVGCGEGSVSGLAGYSALDVEGRALGELAGCSLSYGGLWEQQGLNTQFNSKLPNNTHFII